MNIRGMDIRRYELSRYEHSWIRKFSKAFLISIPISMFHHEFMS